MKLPELFHICADCPMDRMFYGDRVVITGMYVVEIVFCYRKHVLQQKGCFLNHSLPTVQIKIGGVAKSSKIDD